MNSRLPLVTLLLLMSVVQCWSKTLYPPCDVLGLSKMKPSMAAKGRMQDVPDTNAAQSVLARGKQAIPELITCLTDTRKTKRPVFQYWAETTVGDIAFVFLTDLFTDSSWERMTVNGVPSWQSIQAESPDFAAEQAWRNYIQKHDRQEIQKLWKKLWKEQQSRIYWDKAERCFKVRDS